MVGKAIQKWCKRLTRALLAEVKLQLFTYSQIRNPPLDSQNIDFSVTVSPVCQVLMQCEDKHD